MSIVTVFRSRLRPGAEEAYGEVAARMDELVRTMDGFEGQAFWESPDGDRVTLVWFVDEASQRAWANHPEHVAAQRRGRDEFYESFDLSVATLTRRSTFVSGQP